MATSPRPPGTPESTAGRCFGASAAWGSAETIEPVWKQRQQQPGRRASTRVSRASRVLMVGLATLLLAQLSGGCEPESLSVRVSRSGAQRVLQSCEPAADACATHAELNPLTNVLDGTTLEVALVTSSGEIKQRSSCVRTALSPQPTELATLLNDALDRAIPGGITFTDFEKESDATLVALLYASDADTVSCDADRLVGCATFGLVAAGSSSYDVQCSACAGGARTGSGCQAAGECVFGVCDFQCALDVCLGVANKSG